MLSRLRALLWDMRLRIHTIRDRLPIQGLVHRDRYLVPSDESILEIYCERETKGWERYMSSPSLKARVETQGVENLAQIYTRLKYTRESHIEFSENILACLRKQDFSAPL